MQVRKTSIRLFIESKLIEFIFRCCIPLIDIRKNLRHEDIDMSGEEAILESIRQTVLR